MIRALSLGLFMFATLIVGNGCSGGSGSLPAPSPAKEQERKNDDPAPNDPSRITEDEQTAIAACPPTSAAPSSIAPLPTGQVTGETYTSNAPIDIQACVAKRYHAWLGLGSAWIRVEPKDDDTCLVWLGGETENPMYDGSAAQYCEFKRTCSSNNEANTLSVPLGDGGPAHISHTACTP